jgi:hypothetical protein
MNPAVNNRADADQIARHVNPASIPHRDVMALQSAIIRHDYLAESLQ